MTKIVGIPKETKNNEQRVALTPTDCLNLINSGIEVHVEAGAGLGAGFVDGDYIQVGCIIEDSARSLYATSSMIVKVKEPQKSDLKNLRKDHLLFCYLHLAAEPKLTQALKDIGLTAVAFETVVENGSKTPLLAPMSAVAGRLAIQIATWHLHAPRKGRGVLMGGIRGVSAANIVVIGAGVAGQEAATLAHNMGANVTVMDICCEPLIALKKELPNIKTEASTPEVLEKLLPNTDVLVGSVYVIGKKAPVIVTAKQIAMMSKGSVVVDISIDQGGCIATSKPCTHDNPTYMVDGIIHSAITNMPAATPRTASQILSKAILPYVKDLAKGSWSPQLTDSINVKDGRLEIKVI